MDGEAERECGAVAAVVDMVVVVERISGLSGGCTLAAATYSIDEAEADDVGVLLLVTADRPLCENAVVVAADESDDFSFSPRTRSFNVPPEPEPEGG